MKMKFAKYKKNAMDNIRGKWKPIVLGFFIPFIIFLVMIPKSYIGSILSANMRGVSFSDSIEFVAVLSFYGLIEYAFSVGIYNLLLFDSKKEKLNAGGFGRIFLISFAGFQRCIVPVLCTKVIFLFFNVFLSGENLMQLYDIVFFSYFSLGTYIIATDIFNVIITFLCVYINMQYIFTPCILAENPFIGGKEAMLLSKKISNGHKKRIFLLMLSLIFWYIAGMWAMFIGIFFAMAYSAAVKCEYYKTIRPRIKFISNSLM